MLSVSRMRELLDALNSELARDGVRGELFLAGGAVMCLVFRAREATKDIDALLVPVSELRRAAKRIAEREHLPDDWLNDAVKGFFSQTGRFEVYQELSNLRIFAPHPEYLLSMKCMAMRLGEEYHDREDVAALLRILGLRRMRDAEAILGRYYSLDRYPVRAMYVLQELLEGDTGTG
jgi:hypothetical protein